MEIGDKVRFLHEVGGGVVSGFQGKHTVLVQDEDGFDIPMPITEVVVVNTDNYNIPQVQKKPSKQQAEADKLGIKSEEQAETFTSMKARLSVTDDVEEDDDWEPCERSVSFKAAPIERKGGDVLNLSLCFVPTDVKRISSTDFDTYILNDSNYYVHVLYMNAEGERWNLLYQGVVAPNSRVCVDNFDHSVLNSMEDLCLQTMAWKENKSFELKPSLTTEIRLDCTKFYKLHSFHANEHFDLPCWEVPVLREDKSVRQLFVDADLLKESMGAGAQASAARSDVGGMPQGAAGGMSQKELRKMLNKDRIQAPQQGKGAKSQKGRDDLIEVDLHIAELLDTAAGMSPADMLLVQMKEFRRVMDENIRRPGQRIVFIHGKGDGVLRRNLLQELKYRYKQCTWQDASFREYGFGATQVTIHAQPKS